MTKESTLSRAELDDGIVVLRDKIRQFTGQAAALSGAADESSNAARDALGKK